MKKILFLPFLFISVAIVSQVGFLQLGADIDGEAAGDYSGSSVSMNAAGDRVAIGASNSGNGSFSGHVRIYDWDGTAWTQLGADIDGEAAGDRSGTSVSMNAAGDRLAVGAPYNYGNGNQAGHVRIYDWNGTAWTQLGTDIDGEAAGEQSGHSVSMNAAGDRLAIGARANQAGHVRIYDWNGTAWTQLGTNIDGEAAGDYSGCSVSINAAGDRLAIGAYRNDGYVLDAGHVRIYEWNGTAWTQLGADIDGDSVNERSGTSVSMNAAGDRLAVGAPYNYGNGNQAGHVRIYDWDGTAWTQLGADIDGEAAGDRSGWSVSMNAAGDRLAIGARNNANAGHVRIYDWNGTAWTQLGTDIDGEAAGDNSGYSVSINAAGDRVAIGALYNNGNGQYSGHVRIYKECTISYGNDTQTACDSYNWINGITYYASNNSATHILTNFTGCDSIITLDLTVNNSTAFSDLQTACGNYTWIDGNTYNQNINSPTFTLTNSAGCDSIVSLNLTINPDEFNIAISAIQQVFTSPPFAAVFSNNTPNMSDYTFTWDFGDGTTLQTNNSNVFHEYIYNGLYEVKLVAENNTTGCKDTLAEQDYIFTSGGPSVSITEVSNQINIFPNPTNENVTISINNFNGNIQTEVYDLIGNRLQTTNETTISLIDYARGIYLLKVSYGDKVEEMKVIKD